MTPKTPAFLLPILLLLRPSAMPGPGGTLTLAAATNCPADFNITEADDWNNIIKEPKEEEGKKCVEVYVRPEEGFQGVMIRMKVGKSNYESWVNLAEHCFSSNKLGNKLGWYMVKVMVWIQENTSQNENKELILHVEAGKCSAKCDGEVDISSKLTFNLMPQGSSQWRHEKPEDQHCQTIEIELPRQNINCSVVVQTSPTNASNITSVSSTASPGDTQRAPTFLEMVAMVAGVVGGVMLVVVVVVWVKQNRNRRQITGDVMRMPQDPPSSNKVMMENSLYEPFENFRRPLPSRG